MYGVVLVVLVVLLAGAEGMTRIPQVMGILQGRVQPETFYVMDVFALPVEGTETRVNAMDEGYEYMVQYQTAGEQAGRVESVIGW